MNRPEILVINGTCLDVIEDHRAWANGQGVCVVADPSYRGADRQSVLDLARDVEGLIGPFGFRVGREFLEQLPKLRALCLASSGYDSVDIEAATEAGVVVATSPVREGAEVVADFTWGLLLSVVRRIPHHFQTLQRGGFERGMGVSVYGKTLGILGLGNIGKAVVRRSVGFNMDVIAYRADPDSEFVKEYGIEAVGFEELLARSDFLSIHLRLNEETRRIIGPRELSIMKPTAYLVNTARDELVDETALADALENGAIAGGAMDDLPRYEADRLLHHPNFLCTPHRGNKAIEGVFQVTRCALQSAIDILHEKRPKHLLNPEVYEARVPSPAKKEASTR
ncbi:MAG: hypothetical protein H6752_19885 [Candidatus Omnitrophica bacterium]|nr:hypothetical protein [Candidatus Omnitrophota bacterium]